MALWQEIGAAMILASALWAWASVPAPTVAIQNVDTHEGQRVTLVGWPEQLRRGDDWTRFVLVDGTAGIRVYADGAHEPSGGPVAATGRLERVNGHLVLFADEVQWRPLASS